MSEENVEMVKRSIEMFNRGDVDALLRDADSDFEWHGQPSSGLDDPQRCRRRHQEHAAPRDGKPPAIAWKWRRWWMGAPTSWFVVRWLPRGGPATCRFDGHASPPMRSERGVCSVRIFGTRTEALEAAGLEE